MGRKPDELVVTPDLLLNAYSIGLFPMAESADDDKLFWLDTPQRGIFPLNGLIVGHSLAKLVKQERFNVTINHCFDDVVSACAEQTTSRRDTWINADIKQLYGALHRRGHAHSVEVWHQGKLAGGLYGVSLRGAFFGESMFHRARDASKVALVHLVAQMRRAGFVLLDTQFVTPHLASLGAIEIERAEYQARLNAALDIEAEFDQLQAMSGAEVLAAATARE